MKKYFITASILLLAAACNNKQSTAPSWTTYTSLRYNFSIQYPAGWNVSESNEVILVRPGQGADFPPITIMPELVDDPVFMGESHDTCDLKNVTFAGKAGQECASKLNSEVGTRIKLLEIPSSWTIHNEIVYNLPSAQTNLVADYENVLKTFKFTAPTVPVDNTTGWNSYTSPNKYSFSLKYPFDFGFSTDYNQVKGLSYIPSCDENMVACAFLKKENYPGTNFDGAGVSINVTPMARDATCYLDASKKSAGPITINGVEFITFEGGDAGAGHFENIKTYRTFHNSNCYEISSHIGYTNISNYPAGTVSQFDQNEVWQKLQGVVNSFEF